MEWVRGHEVGRGSFATISLAIPRKSCGEIPPLIAVKSSESLCSASLKNEKEVLDQIGTCPEIIQCFGDNYSSEKGTEYYNLLLEYANGGSLADQLKNHGGRLMEPDARRFTRAILKGLQYIHGKGFVHCDIKLGNILVFNSGETKIADFGLAKKAGQSRAETGHAFEWRGTPLYMSPESVNDNEYESECDIWALGCAVVEMVTGKPAWNFWPGSNIYQLLLRIGSQEESPEVPSNLSDDGKDFLGKCFVKDPRKRWSAEMLLNHPFVATAADDTVPLKQMDEFSTSPRGPFDYPDWVSAQSVGTSQTYGSSPELSPEFNQPFQRGSSFSCFDSSCCSSSLSNRLHQIATDESFDWLASDDWLTVR